MPYANTNTLTANDMNNVRRGLYRDNTDHTLTGAVAESDLASVTITGGTIGATGRLIVEAAGAIANAAGTKRIRMLFGATAIYDTTAQAGTADWWVRAVISNTATGAQRISVTASDHTSATALTQKDYTTAAIDTTANVILKLVGTPAGAADTITQTKFEVEVQQIT